LLAEGEETKTKEKPNQNRLLQIADKEEGLSKHALEMIYSNVMRISAVLVPKRIVVKRLISSMWNGSCLMSF
jgi:hypothetical protein